MSLVICHSVLVRLAHDNFLRFHLLLPLSSNQRFETRGGLKLVAMKFMQASVDHMKLHYADLASKPFFNGMVEYMASSPVVPMVWEGLNAAKIGRMLLGRETRTFTCC